MTNSIDTTPRFYSIDDVRVHYLRNNRGGHWFSENSTRYFKTRYSDAIYITPGDTSTVYFVTSERNGYAYNAPRAYSVRVYDVATASVTTFGTFGAHNTLAQAKSAARVATGAK